MKSRVRLLVLGVAARFASGQALFTGETSGTGVSSVFVAGTASLVRDFTIPANLWTAYTRGLNHRVDAFAFYGNLTIFGQTQHYGGVGSNIGILKRARHRLDVAFLNSFSTPLNRRHQAATVSATFALIGSRPIRIRTNEMTLYSGYIRGEPFGRRADKLFSPRKGTHNGILGALFPVSKSLALVAEYDPGGNQQNFGVALLYLFPRK